jgi:outer membrane protein assembly factor BamA
VLIVTVGLAIVLPALALVALQIPAVRGAILARVAGAVENRTGIRLTARDFRLELRGGVVEVQDLALTAPGSGEVPPFLTTSRVRAVIQWSTLLGDRPVIESLSVASPRVDLRAPIVSPGADAGEGDAGAPSLEILSIDLTDGALLGPPPPETMDVLFDEWRAEGVRVRGEYRAGQVTVEEATARLIAESHRRDPMELLVDTTMNGDIDTGAFALDSLQIRGNGLTLDARGTFSTDAPAADVSLGFDFEPAVLFPDLSSSGRARGSGEVRLVRSPTAMLEGVLQLQAADIPAELASPWIDGVDVRGPLDPSGTHLDVNLDLDFAIALERVERPEPLDRVVGNADLTWRRASEPLATATVRSLETGAGTAAAGVRMSFTGDVLPTAPGRRRVSGELLAPAWVEVLEGSLRSVHIDLDEPDVERAFQNLGVDPSTLPAWLPRGKVTASLKADGPVTSPRLHLESEYRRGTESLATVSARTLGGDVRALHLAFDASLLPQAPGQRRLSGTLLAPGWDRIAEAEIRDGRVDVELDDLAAAERDLGQVLPGLVPHDALPEAIRAAALRGRLSATVDASGPIMSPDLRVEAGWAPSEDESVRLAARGRPSPRSPFLDPGAAAELSVRNLDLSSLGVEGRADGRLGVGIADDGIEADLRVAGDRLAYGDLVSVDDLRLEASVDGEVLDLRDLSGKVQVTTPQLTAAGELSGSGRFDLSWPPRYGEAKLAIDGPVEGIDRIEAILRLENGTLHLEKAKVRSAGDVASMEAAVPLGTLAEMFPAMEPFVQDPATGPITVTVSNVDLPTIARMLDPAGSMPPLHGTLDASLTFDPRDPVGSTGWLTVAGIGVDLEGETVGVGRTLRIEMADGRILFPRTLLQPTGGLIRGNVPLEIAAQVDLAPTWKPGDDLAALVDRFSLAIDGTVDARLLNRFLAGGSAVGEVNLAIEATGTMEEMNADVRIRGPNASIFYRQPYATRLEAFEIDLTTDGREVRLERAVARLNGGEAEMTGRFTTEDGLDARLRLDGARYRLDFGITTRVSGDVRIDWPLDGRRRLSGEINIERAVLRRSITLNREVLRTVFDLDPETGANPVLDTIDLDLSVLTDEGVLVRNNVANVRADWGRLQITGTAGDPRIEGRVDVEPGGIVTVLGIAYRIEQASVEWYGDRAAEPRWVLDWTSSLDDPTVIQSWRNELFNPMDLGPGRGGVLDFQRQAGAGSGVDVGWQAMAAGVATQATSAHRTQLTFEPLPLFGETDTLARFTLSQDLSPQITFIASTNPRETEAQTFILDLHRFPGFESFRAQVFSNDQKNAGLTIQQTLKLGPRPASETRDPLVRRRIVDAPEGIRKGRLRRSIDYRRSDPFPPGAAMDVEVDVGDAMRRKGYLSSTVEVDVEEAGQNRVDLLVTVEPGTRVEFVFEGDALPSRARRSIVSAYRPLELGVEASLEEVQIETARALRSLGYTDPRVDVVAVAVDPMSPDEETRIRVIADGGRRLGLSSLVVEGVQAEDAQRVRDIFRSTSRRLDLATAAPAADAILLRALDDRGYPEARIAERSLSDDGETLTVRIEPGERRQVASIEIEGLEEPDRARMVELLGFGVGDPARSDLIGQGARAMERDLRDRGHADARVRAFTRPVDEDHVHDVAVRYEADPGASYRIAEVRFEGLRASRQSWVENVAELEPGEMYRQRDVAEARGRLTRTGVFQQVRTSSEPVEEGSADTVLTFELEEARPWRLAYGGRWEGGKGISVVVDALRQNSLGRGHLTGMRGIVGRDLQSARLYHVIPRIVGERSSLELFLEGRREELSSTLEVRTTELWAQLTFPLTRRLYNRPYVRFQDPEYTVEEPGTTAPPDERVISPLLGWQLAFDAERRAAGEDRRKGMFVGLDLLGSLEQLGSDVTSWGVVGQLKYFLPLGKAESGRFTWAQFWRTGWNEAKDEPIPLVDRFRAGGEFSVRGYPTNSLGPIGEDGLPLGGELMFVVNQEIHANLIRTRSAGAISGLAFFDAGNVWLNRSTLDSELFKSVGVGVRYLSPFGPFRMDLAFPLDRRPDDPTSKVYFGFGSVF